MIVVDVAAVIARQADRDCLFTRDCRNLTLALEMGAEVETTLTSIAAEILRKDYIPLPLENCSNSAIRYACYLPIK